MIRTAFLAAITLFACPAGAADLGHDLHLGGGVTGVTDYRFRGISRSDEEPALQATLNLDHDSGFYTGAWGSTLRRSPLGDAELDLYGGWRTDIAGGTTLDLGLLYYAFPGGRRGYAEPYASVSHILGPVTAKLGAAYAWDQDAIGNDDSFYLFTDWSAGIPASPVTLRAHLGRSDGGLAPTGDYLDWSLGAEIAQGPATVGLAYVDTDLRNVRGASGGLILSLGFSF